MPIEMNPYDDGFRLKPKVWVNDGIAGDEDPRPADADDYGRVDFDNDAGETVTTVWIQKTEAGYILRVEEHQDVELAIETGSDRQIRETAMMKLDADLRVAAAEYDDYITLSEQDPETFGAGHYVIESDDRLHRLTINEQYVGTDSSDPWRVPNTWLYEIEKVEHASIRGGEWTTVSSKEVGPADVDQLVLDAKAWLQSVPAPQEVERDAQYPFRQDRIADLRQAPPAPSM